MFAGNFNFIKKLLKINGRFSQNSHTICERTVDVMSYFIVAIIFFALGSTFGIGWMCLFNAGKQADEEMQEMEVKLNEQ